MAIEVRYSQNGSHGVTIYWSREGELDVLNVTYRGSEFRGSDLAAMSDVVAAVVRKGPPKRDDEEE